MNSPGFENEIKPGSWVQAKKTVLKPEQRPDNLPEDTKKVPLEMKVKGFIEDRGRMGETVTLKTIIGREITGELVEVNPPYDHNFGTPPRELLDIGPELKKILSNYLRE